MKNKLHRLFLIFSSVVSPDTLNDYMKRITEIFTDFGIKIIDTEQSKNFPLAYAINGVREGFQVVLQVEINPKSRIKNILISETYKLIRQYCRDDLLRSQFFCDDHKVFESLTTKAAEEHTKTIS
jgi:ribosomal protein S6